MLPNSSFICTEMRQSRCSRNMGLLHGRCRYFKKTFKRYTLPPLAPPTIGGVFKAPLLVKEGLGVVDFSSDTRRTMIPLSSADYDAIRLSVQVAIAATMLSLPFGFAVAYLITFVRFRGKVLLEVLVNLPLTLPPVVVGYFLLLLLGKHGWLGSLLNS